MTDTPTFACAILANTSGMLLLQRRLVAGKDAITVFGGHLGSGEDCLDGLARELRDEIQYDVDPRAVVEVGDFERDDDKKTVCRLFLIRDVAIEDIQATEGEPILLTPEAAGSHPLLTNTTRDMVSAVVALGVTA